MPVHMLIQKDLFNQLKILGCMYLKIGHRERVDSLLLIEIQA